MMTKMMMRMPVMAASTAAVGPKSLDKSKSSTEFAESIPGAIAPVGFFDPLKFHEGRSSEEITRYREAELTHGRVAMLATVGFVVGEQVEGSSFLFDKYISGPAIGHFQQVEEVAPAFWEGIALVVAICETIRVQAGWKSPYEGEGNFLLKDDYYPGALYFDPLGLTPDNQEDFEDMQLKELSHCRLAMIAAAGFLAQEAVSGDTWGAYWGDASF